MIIRWMWFRLLDGDELDYTCRAPRVRVSCGRKMMEDDELI